MIDLHCHILPGIDDGAHSLDRAVEMCRAAAEAGTEALVATPHQRRGEWWNYDRATLEQLRRRLQAAVGPQPRILGGGEIRVDPQFLGEMMHWRASDSEGPLSLGGSRYLLLEFAPIAEASDAGDLVHELRVAGWRPILAHPEHISWMTEDLAVVAQLVSLGALCQVTAMSLTGDFGRRAQAKTQRLIDAGLAHFVASDAHDLLRRPPSLVRAWDAIAARWGEARARELLHDNPAAVIADRPLPAEMLDAHDSVHAVGAAGSVSAIRAVGGADTVSTLQAQRRIR
jgi:protein-tyrosine phosphatase